MEYINSVWQISIIALVAGAMIGALAYRLFSPSVKQADKIMHELDETREELGSYKASVNSHFNKTSELVNDLTQNYVKVYQHLAEGALTLGDSRTLTNLLEQHQGKVLISVDEEGDAPDTLASEPPIDPITIRDMPEEPANEYAGQAVDPDTDKPDPENSAADAGITETVKSSDSPDDIAEAMEPVLNVDAIAEVTEKADSEVKAEADKAIPEGKEKTEARTTTH